MELIFCTRSEKMSANSKNNERLNPLRKRVASMSEVNASAPSESKYGRSPLELCRFYLKLH